MTPTGPERTAADTLISGTVIIERSENSVRTFSRVRRKIYLNGKPHEIEKEFGEFTVRADGTVEVFWALPKKVLHTTVEPPVPSVEELLVGYALASAFGTGALSLTTIIMGAVTSMMP